jgi:4-methylaminobutanoate oxidase (formaldehyde-forming)
MHQTGCLYAAVSADHQESIRELAKVTSQAGVKLEWLDSVDAVDLIPWLKLPSSASVVFTPEDGYIDGYTLASGYIKAARSLGVEICEQTSVLSILYDGKKVTGVKTSKGEISAPLVIDAAGVWAGMLASEIGICMPMAPVRSHYWITESHSLFSPDQPFVILPDARAYARPESNHLLFGFRELQSVSVDPRQLPENMNGYTFDQDPHGWDSLLEGIPGFEKLFPLAEEIKISNYIKGLSNYTPDGNFVLGEFPSRDGFLAATGCAGAGIAMSGGIGRFVSELAVGQTPFVESAPHRIDRFGMIDPTDLNFLQICADARSGKVTG